MKVGCVTEIKKLEHRVGLTPENVRSYVEHGHKVYIQMGAGAAAGFEDKEYAAYGAILCNAAAEIWAVCDMIVKVKEPMEEEYDLMREGQIIYTYLHLAANKPLIDAMLKAKCKGVAYETVVDEKGTLPLLKPMSEIAGRLCILEGAKCLQKHEGGEGILLQGVPGVPKAKVVIIGAGNVGTNACTTAVGMGAQVTIIDRNLNKLTDLDNRFGTKIQTLYLTDAVIEKAVIQADLVVGAVLVRGGQPPKLIKKQYVKEMKKGSVIVDVSIDQGGICETIKQTYHDVPSYVVDGVVHYGVGNMPGAVPRTATMALTNATLKYGLCIADHGLEEASKIQHGVYEGINVYNGYITYENVANAFGMEYKAPETLFNL